MLDANLIEEYTYHDEIKCPGCYSIALAQGLKIQLCIEVCDNLEKPPRAPVCLALCAEHLPDATAHRIFGVYGTCPVIYLWISTGGSVCVGDLVPDHLSGASCRPGV